MVDELKLSIINMMSNSDWMDSSTKRNAIAKVTTCRYIGTFFSFESNISREFVNI